MTTHQNLEPAHARHFASNPIVAVLVVQEPADAVACCRALVSGGVPTVELALRTDGALDCIAAVAKEVPELLAVAGTVLTVDQVRELARRGVKAAVAPGCNPKVIRAAREAGLSFAPGVCTPSDIEQALEAGCTMLKYFPAEPSGGLAMLKSMAAPYLHLGVQFIPLGGLKPEHVGDYLKSPLVAALGGTWICPAELVEAKQWGEVTKRAREAMEAARKARPA